MFYYIYNINIIYIIKSTCKDFFYSVVSLLRKLYSVFLYPHSERSWTDIDYMKKLRKIMTETNSSHADLNRLKVSIA